MHDLASVLSEETIWPREVLAAHPLGIILACVHGRIVGDADLDAAIEAHKAAFQWIVRTEDEGDRRMVALTLLTVIHAATGTPGQIKQQFDYLAALPIDAWGGVIYGNPASFRENTLATCERRLAINSGGRRRDRLRR